MWPGIKVDSWGFAIVVALLLYGATMALSVAFPDGPDYVVVVIRGTLLFAGVVGLIGAAGFARVWYLLRQGHDDVVRDRSWDPAPAPAGLTELQAELAELGFIPAGKAELVSARDYGGRIYQYFARPSNPYIVASLSFSRRGGSFNSYLQDGRALETVYPPLKWPRRRGWKVLPDSIEAKECPDGAAALSLHEAWLAAETAKGIGALPIPDYAYALTLENAATLRIRDFHDQQALRELRRNLWQLLLAPAALWVALFWTWR